LAPGLLNREPGIWFAPRQRDISYPAHGNAACLDVEDGSFWFQHRNRCIASVVQRFAPRGVFLDVGGGNGFVASALLRAGIQCVLLEPGLEGARAALARGVEPVICATLEEAGLLPGSVAAVGMFDVLEHIEDDVGALQQVHRLLEPGGRVFLTVPAYQLLYSADDDAAGHFRRYTRSGLRRVLQSAGFQIEFASYIFAPLPPLILLMRTVPSRLGMRSQPKTGLDTTAHAPRGMVARLLDRLLAAERARLAGGRTLPLGGSVLCAATRR